MEKLTTNQVNWNDGMSFAIVCGRSNAVVGQDAMMPTVKAGVFASSEGRTYALAWHYLVERSEMFDHSKPNDKRLELVGAVNFLKAKEFKHQDFILGIAVDEYNQCVTELSLNKYGQVEFDLYSIHSKQLLTKGNSDYSYYNDIAKPCVKDAEIILKALADEDIKNLGAEAAAKKDFTEHEKSLGVVNNYTSEDITPIGDLEQMAVMATLRKMRGEYFESLHNNIWAGVDGTHIDLALFHRKAESPEQKAARERAELVCKWVDDIFYNKSMEELACLLIDAGVKLPVHSE